MTEIVPKSRGIVLSTVAVMNKTALDILPEIGQYRLVVSVLGNGVVARLGILPDPLPDF